MRQKKHNVKTIIEPKLKNYIQNYFYLRRPKMKKEEEEEEIRKIFESLSLT